MIYMLVMPVKRDQSQYVKINKMISEIYLSHKVYGLLCESSLGFPAFCNTDVDVYDEK